VITSSGQTTRRAPCRDRCRAAWCALPFALLVILTGGLLAGSPVGASTPVATPAVIDPCRTGIVSGTPVAAGEDRQAQAPPEDRQMAVDFDLLFLDLMIPHHETAVVMAQIAVARAAHAELAELGARIVVRQGQALELMRAWRASWYGDAPALSAADMMAILDAMAADSPGHAGLPGAMDMVALHHDPLALCETEGPFDLAFLDEMIEFQQSAVLFSRAAEERAIHPEVRELAAAIASEQQQEIERMVAWRETWYGGTPVAGERDG
jgi:uncharacterized protein (DUF305 family)